MPYVLNLATGQLDENASSDSASTANVTALAAATGYEVGQMVWAVSSAQSSYGLMYMAVPLGTYTAVGDDIVNGQGVQWINLVTYLRINGGLSGLLG